MVWALAGSCIPRASSAKPSVPKTFVLIDISEYSSENCADTT
jgi:hypothetical protein